MFAIPLVVGYLSFTNFVSMAFYPSLFFIPPKTKSDKENRDVSLENK